MKGKIYSEDLGIDLNLRKNFFKWFLTCSLFEKPIKQV